MRCQSARLAERGRLDHVDQSEESRADCETAHECGAVGPPCASQRSCVVYQMFHRRYNPCELAHMPCTGILCYTTKMVSDCGAKRTRSPKDWHTFDRRNLQALQAELAFTDTADTGRWCMRCICFRSSSGWSLRSGFCSSILKPRVTSKIGTY